MRIGDDLHQRIRTKAAGGSVNAFVREAVAEKVGREQLDERVTKLEQRVKVLERRLND